MFGYVRPDKGMLRVCELERFRAEYCGLCHALRRRYGMLARYLLHYDFAFLSLLLSDGPCSTERRRCPASPLKKRCVCRPGAAHDAAADATVLMAWYKLADEAADGGFWRRLGARAARRWLDKKAGRAAAALPATDRVCRAALSELAGMEKERLPSLDRPADTFARMLSALSEAAPPGRARALAALLYHVGRWIYLVDACDDLADDAARGQYNPVSARFALTEGKLGESARAELETTLAFSRSEAQKAYALMDDNENRDIVWNILSLGLAAVEREALSGRRRKPDEGPL